MSKIETLHNKAMDIAEEAFIAQKKGEELEAIELFKKSLIYERQAADLLSISVKNEPTRSILYRSSAALAQNSNQFEIAEQLIGNGLAGFPPAEIKEELRNLYEDINFMRHLSIKGMSLADDQWLMSLDGNSTRYGGAAADLLLMRVDKVSTLFYRTVERLLKIPYRRSGGVSKDIKNKYGLYIKAFAPASFAVSFQVGRPDPQRKLFPDFVESKPVEASEVIDEILSCFELFEEEKTEKLKNRFEDDEYHDNFVALAKVMAPDGDDIKLVGFNSIKNGKNRPVALRKTRKKIKITTEDAQNTTALSANEQILSGTLMHAHSPEKGKSGTVKLRSHQDKKTYTISVPIVLMKDIVQPYYEEEVVIRVHTEGKKIILDDIDRDSK